SFFVCYVARTSLNNGPLHSPNELSGIRVGRLCGLRHETACLCCQFPPRSGQSRQENANERKFRPMLASVGAARVDQFDCSSYLSYADRPPLSDGISGSHLARRPRALVVNWITSLSFVNGDVRCTKRRRGWSISASASVCSPPSPWAPGSR